MVLNGCIIRQVGGGDEHLDLITVGGRAVGGRGLRGRALGHLVDGGSATEEIRVLNTLHRVPHFVCTRLNIIHTCVLQRVINPTHLRPGGVSLCLAAAPIQSRMQRNPRVFTARTNIAIAERRISSRT